MEIPMGHQGWWEGTCPESYAVTIARISGLLVKETQAGESLPKMETTEENSVVFVVENSAEYMYQLEQAFRRADVPLSLKIARYGNEAILYLKGVGIYGDRTNYPLPRVILLDLDLPDGSPLAVLGWIRQQPDLQGIGILLTGYPDHHSVIEQAREMGALAWFPKTDYGSIISNVQSLLHTRNGEQIAA